MRTVYFSEVQIGCFFKETPEGSWHLKTSGTHAMYQSDDSRMEPRFSADEQVWIE